MISIDQGKPVLFVLLDLSVTFDKVDHLHFFSSLKYILSLSDKVLGWFQSYLEQRSQRVSINDIISLSGVPQGSILGPLVFTMYTHVLGINAQRYGTNYQLYADNTQLYR